MFGFVYIWRDKKRKKFYIGSHGGVEDDRYTSSSPWMEKAYNKRPHDFKRRILERIEGTRKEIFEQEQKWLNMIPDHELGHRYYNLTKSVGHWVTDEYSALSIREKISQRTKEEMAKPENRERHLESQKNKDQSFRTEEWERKRIKSIKKTKLEQYPLEKRKVRISRDSEEHSENMRRNTTELWNRPGYRERVGKKISEGLKGKQNRLGQKNSEEHKRKISEAKKGKTRLNYKVEVEGRVYNSFEELSNEFGVSVPTIYRRLKSGEWIRL